MPATTELPTRPWRPTKNHRARRLQGGTAATPSPLSRLPLYLIRQHHHHTPPSPSRARVHPVGAPSACISHQAGLAPPRGGSARDSSDSAYRRVRGCAGGTAAARARTQIHAAVPQRERARRSTWCASGTAAARACKEIDLVVPAVPQQRECAKRLTWWCQRRYRCSAGGTGAACLLDVDVVVQAVQQHAATCIADREHSPVRAEREAVNKVQRRARRRPV
eukprot:357327-Chlamydomonas_euryale.AAC.3